MIKKLRKKFIATAMVSIFILLFAILATINIVNFSMVASDAERMLDGIISENGVMSQPLPAESDSGMMRGPMGPDAPDTKASTRFFTFAFSIDGTAREIAFNMSAVNIQSAEEWARSLISSKGGWTKTTYRFRTYSVGNETFVTVIDQGRELLPSYRVLWASVIGSAVGLAVSFGVLLVLSGRFVKPIVDSDKKQKKFISDAARELKTPITVMALDMERVKNKGADDATKSLDRQLNKITDLAMKLNDLLVIEQEEPVFEKFDFSETARRVFGRAKFRAEEKGILFKISVSDGIVYNGDETMLEKALTEIADNAVKFAVSETELKVGVEQTRITIETVNDAENIEDGDLDTVFERFYKGDESSDGKGLGLSVVKGVVEAHGGRVRARGEKGRFILKAEL